MVFWKKKGPKIGEEDENPAEQEIEEASPDNNKKNSANVELELAKIKGQLDSLSEMRKATTDRFGMTNEQIGELRGTINDLTQSFSKVEIESTKVIDQVKSIEPEKFMTELRKNEGRLEALKANIESNESLMQDIMKQLKSMRQEMSIYKGTDQIIKLHEEIKEELANIKKVEAIVQRHADRVENIFMDVEKKFMDFDKFDSSVKDLSRTFNKIQGDFDKLRVKSDQKAEKTEFVGLLNKFNDFEKHTGNIIKLMDERSKHMKNDLQSMFNKLKRQIEFKTNKKLSVETDSVEPDDDGSVSVSSSVSSAFSIDPNEKKGFFKKLLNNYKEGKSKSEPKSEPKSESNHEFEPKNQVEAVEQLSKDSS
ncbi:MAG: hypothetical protein ABIC91_02565 [Nanoarchaeota archaeon]